MRALRDTVSSPTINRSYFPLCLSSSSLVPLDGLFLKLFPCFNLLILEQHSHVLAQYKVNDPCSLRCLLLPNESETTQASTIASFQDFSRTVICDISMPAWKLRLGLDRAPAFYTAL